MLLTKQQKYLLAVLEQLGCAEQRQLAALLQKTFAFSSIDDAVRVTNACVPVSYTHLTLPTTPYV